MPTTNTSCYKPPFPPCDDDVVEYANLASFPATGSSNTLYIDGSTNSSYYWNGTSYEPLGSTADIYVNGGSYDSTNGQITLNDTDAGTPDVVIPITIPDNGAYNGTSIDTNTNQVVLGNDVGDTDSQLVSDREIPTDGFDINITGDGNLGLGNVTNPGAKIDINNSQNQLLGRLIQNSNKQNLFIQGQQTSEPVVQIRHTSANINSRELLYLEELNPNNIGDGIRIRYDGLGDAIFIDSNQGTSINIDSEDTNDTIIKVQTQLETGLGIDMNAVNLTTGTLARFLSNSSNFSNTTTGLLDINVGGSGATGDALMVSNNGTGHIAKFTGSNGNDVNIDSGLDDYSGMVLSRLDENSPKVTVGTGATDASPTGIENGTGLVVPIDGATGSFTAGGNTINVVNGIITSII